MASSNGVLQTEDQGRRPSRFKIGYALSAKKAQSFLRQELIDACRQRNVLFLRIDKTKRLVEAAEVYDAILHKDSSPDWVKQLEEYKACHPSCVLLDDPKHIIPLHNRVSMLQCVDDSLLSCLHESSPAVTLKVPRQTSVTGDQELHNAFGESSMKFPLVAKPLVADGSAESHKMFLVLNTSGLEKLSPPVVIQEFINHGGVIFKVYVVGDTAICTPRKSLQDCDETDLEDPEGVIGFSQVSNLQSQQQQPQLGTIDSTRRCSSSSLTSLDTEVELSSVQLPSEAFISDLARLLRERLQLNLFNFDLIQDTKTSEFYIVDINYFPGFAKMPSYLSVLPDFFESLAKTSQHSEH